VIEWFTLVQVIVAGIAAVICVVAGLSKRGPNDYTVGSIALIELLLVAQLVVSIVAQTVGNHSRGNIVEFYIYLVVALLLAPLAVVWALVDRSRWSNVVMGAGAFAVAVMTWRMYQIWTQQYF